MGGRLQEALDIIHAVCKVYILHKYVTVTAVQRDFYLLMVAACGARTMF
jgi:hypothetical protein